MSNALPDSLEFRPVDLNDRALFETVARWYQDPEILAMLTPNRQEQPLAPPTVEQMIAGFQSFSKRAWFIFHQGRLIGEVSLIADFPFLMRPVRGTAWISIAIGERDCWGMGAGAAAMRFLEETSRSLGYRRIELGVFACNQRALALYRRSGYRLCGVNRHFTYWNGIWHDDYRLEKWLEPGH